MFLFEKSSIGAHYNRFYDLKERRGPFLCYGRIKANSADKNLKVTNIDQKAGLPNCQICLPLDSSFLCLLKRPPFGRKHVKIF